MRYFIAFSYFGKFYHGWQKQPNAITVQQVLQEVMSKMLRQPINLTGAGRTDSGVHATQMYAHFDFDVIDDCADLVYRMNSFLPNDIAVQNINIVPDNAHARFDALERTYEYWVVQQKDPFQLDSAYYVKQPLDQDAMNKAAQLLLTHDDFECFSKSNTEVYTFLCDIKSAYWEERKGKLVFNITANRFLRNMVRAIVGTLLEVGKGKSDIENVKRIIESKDRNKAGVSVPAQGLYLTKITYPKTHFNK